MFENGKRKINIGKNKGKIGRPAPDWFLNLAEGEYTVKELTEISNTCARSVLSVMTKHNISFYEVKAYPNLIKKIFIIKK